MKSIHFTKNVLSAFSLFGMSCALTFGLTGEADAQRYYPVTTQAQTAMPADAMEQTAQAQVVSMGDANAMVPQNAVPANATATTAAGVPADAVMPAEAYAGAPEVYSNAPTYGGEGYYTTEGMADGGYVAVGAADGGYAEEPRGLFLHNIFPTPCVNNGFGPGSFFMEGFISQGWNFSGNNSDYLEPVGPNDKAGYQMKQLYLSFGRRIAHGDSWAVGVQGDLLFGTDYYYATATGLESNHNGKAKLNGMSDNTAYRAGHNEYGLAIPQAYLEVYCPWLQGIDVKVGHFYSVMGYESTPATANFFASRSYTSLYGMPRTMSGVMTNSRLGDRLTLILGAVNEWDAFDTPKDYFSFVGGFSFENYCRSLSLTAVVMTGKQSYGSEVCADGADTTVFDLCAKWNITPCFSYVAEFTVGSAKNPYYCMETNNWKKGREWYGFSNYLFWQCRETLTLGFRFEMFSDPNDTVINSGYGMAWNDHGSVFYDWSLCANWDPCHWLTVRPEVRWDYSNWKYADKAGTGTYDQNTSLNQFTGSVDLIVRF